MNLQKGFTLVELLTVLAIVTLLAGLSVFAWQRARLVADRTVCASNLREIGGAALLYLQDHDLHYPGSTHSDILGQQSQSWVYTLSPYLEDIESVKLCPADPHYEERRKSELSSYTVNYYLTTSVMDPFGNAVGPDYTCIINLPNPARTFFAFPVSDRAAISISSDHTHADNWFNWKNCLPEIQPNRFKAGGATRDGLGGDANYLYADGHVGNLRSEDFRQLFSSVGNPANPANY